MTLIAFVGSVFSPYYAFARRRGMADPEQHCAINVSLTGAAGHRWTMTERDRRALHRSARHIAIGPSQLSWNGQSLVADISEVTAPWPRRLRGSITLHPAALTSLVVPLGGDKSHFWCPIAPVARAVVRLENPKLSWTGQAYFDSNYGRAPLEHDFQNWSWSRTVEAGRTRVLYDVTPSRDRPATLAVGFNAHGEAQEFDAPLGTTLPKTFWRLPRQSRSECAAVARVLATWEDGPFYARSLIETRLGGETVTAVHESLSLERFQHPLVQAMLPFRMPRRRRHPRTSDASI